MAEIGARDRLQPSLLDRLIDDRRGIEVDLARDRQRLLALLDEAERAAFARLIEGERRLLRPLTAEDLVPFARLDEDGLALMRRVVELEQRRFLLTRQHHVVSLDRLRELVLRDLGTLFNTDNLACVTPLDDLPLVRASVVNYGMPPLAGASSSGLDIESLERLVRDAIRDFEPRIRRDTVRVRAVVDDETYGRRALVFEIEGDLYGEPLPLKMFLRTIIDLEDGRARVIERAA